MLMTNKLHTIVSPMMRHLTSALCTVLVFAFALAAIGPGGHAAAQSKSAAKSTEKAEAGADASRAQALAHRVEQLEEQLVDMQVVVGTLESLASTRGQSDRVAFTGSARTPANADLQTQLAALQQQVAKLSTEVQTLQNAPGQTFSAGQDPYGSAVQSQYSSAPYNAQVSHAQTSFDTEPQQPDYNAPAPSFGATTVSRSEQPDQIGALIQSQELPQPENFEQLPDNSAALQPAPLNDPFAAPPAGPTAQPAQDDEPRQVYEGAYNALLQQDVAGAQSGFREFLRRFPKHALVPNALYWLGETYYVQQNYTDAAEAFDIVTAAYASSNKAPDSQLKRGMSLANLGKTQEACTVLSGLAQRYPNAPEHVKAKADSERARAGCS